MKTTIQLGLLAIALTTAGNLSAADAKADWAKECAKCHGADGRGQTKMGRQTGAKDYSDPKVQAEMDDAKAFQRTKEGLKENGKEKIKSYAGILTDDQIKALVVYMRTFKK